MTIYDYTVMKYDKIFFFVFQLCFFFFNKFSGIMLLFNKFE